MVYLKAGLMDYNLVERLVDKRDKRWVDVMVARSVVPMAAMKAKLWVAMMVEPKVVQLGARMAVW